MMSMTKFEKLLSVYGADPARWPDADAPNARALLAESQDARSRCKRAEALDRALDSFAPPPLPAGLSVRAANESLLRARPVKKARFRLPEFSPEGIWGGGSWLPAGAGLAAVAAAVALIVFLPHQRTVPQPQDVAEVGSFIQSLDQLASKTDTDIKDTDEVLAMLDAAQPAAPQVAPDGNGVTSDELMKTLFDDDKSDDNSL
jgi:hypothetical protein